MSTKAEQIQIQNRINELTTAIDAGDSEVQLSLWEIERTEKRNELVVALAEEANHQQREQVQEEEVQAITLPYDFNDILSEEGHQITVANEMIIEVVRDVKRQANVEKNQAVDEVKAEYDGKLRVLQANIDDHKNVIVELTQNLTDLKDDYDDLESQKNILQSQHETMHQKASQAITDRDDAFTKRDNAFRDLQAAREEIDRLQKQLENVPAAKSIEISSSDKLAKMVKDSLAEKVNRGLSRWPEIKPIDVPSLPEQIAPLEIPALQEVHTHTPQESTNHDVHSGGIAATEGNQTVHELVQPAESQVSEPIPHDEMLAKLYQAHNELKADHADLAARVDRIEVQANIRAA